MLRLALLARIAFREPVVGMAKTVNVGVHAVLQCALAEHCSSCSCSCSSLPPLHESCFAGNWHYYTSLSVTSMTELIGAAEKRQHLCLEHKWQCVQAFLAMGVFIFTEWLADLMLGVLWLMCSSLEARRDWVCISVCNWQLVRLESRMICCLG